MVSYECTVERPGFYHPVLILIVVEDGLVPTGLKFKFTDDTVLILIVVDNGLVHQRQRRQRSVRWCLNPYCSGQWSRTPKTKTAT